MSKVFDSYAAYYDLLYQDKDYAAEAAYVGKLIHRLVPGATRLLELGCGTGGHASELAHQGFRIHGVDLSEGMLSRAYLRKYSLPGEVAARISFSAGDVRSVQTGETYDAVISLFHVMSYQTTQVDIVAAFETASAHLAPGGIFIFDFWYGPAVLTQKPEVRVKRLEDQNIKVTRIAEPAIRTEENIVDVNYTLFIQEKHANRIERLNETHQMRYFFLPELYGYGQDKFERAFVYQWMSNTAINSKSWSGVLGLVRK